MNLSGNINEDREKFKQILKYDKNFDITNREIIISKNTKASLFFIDGFIKDAIMEKIMEFLYGLSPDKLKDFDTFIQSAIPHIEAKPSNDVNELCTNVFSGFLVILVDGFDKAVYIDIRKYPARDVAEPEKDRVLRGSRDGFVETLLANTALIRRRIRDSKFIIEFVRAGTRSKTDIAICYMDDLVDKKLLKRTIQRIKDVNVKALTMNQQSLMEAIYHYKWYNPFPKFKNTERPDTAVTGILDGNIVILVDNSPDAVMIPTSIFDIIEEADDYYFPPVIGTYLRISRYLITLITLFLTPIWLLFTQNPQWIPPAFDFTVIHDQPGVPIFWQLIILELAIDGLRLASLNTPNNLNTALSVIGGIVLSEFAVESGWFNMQAMLYMAFVAVAAYSQQSYELGYALKFMRVLLLICTALFNLLGFIVGVVIISLFILTNKTICGKSYLYPLIPFKGREFAKKFLRVRQTGCKVK